MSTSADQTLERTVSKDSATSRKSNSHSLSAALNDNTALSRKARPLDPTLSPNSSAHVVPQSAPTLIPSDALRENSAPDLDSLKLALPPSSLDGAPGAGNAQRRSNPEIGEIKTAGLSTSIFNYGAGLYNGMKAAYGSEPSSVAGGSEVDSVRPSTVPEGRLSSDSGGAVRQEKSDQATTATSAFSVTTQSQNGALSPSAKSSGTDPFVAGNNTALPVGIPPPGSPQPNQRSQPRPSRGRTPGNSRRVSGSAPSSTSNSVERSGQSDKPNPNRIGTIGICALDSKARSKPSRNILNRLVGKDHEFDVLIFGDKVILDESVENWPVCDFLISFFSDGFPLEKAIAYAKLRKPFCVNDLPMQTILWDRRMCLMILDKLGVPTPARLEVNRDGGPVLLSTDIAQRLQQLTGLRLRGNEDGRGGAEPSPDDVHMEDDNDTLVVNGKRLTKPFVEKPVSGEDHNIYIYYPRSQGGGGRRLFRKVNNKSSEKDEDLIIPRCFKEDQASYIYEQFVKVENAEDVKAYTVGPDYCHAETRKSPVVDGLVKRNPNGKEIRYMTALTKEEQIMAAKIAEGFGQRVCGFDLLRVEERSYVIDVNGWSFVKDNNEYYDKCASILRSIFIREKLRWEGRETPSESADDEAPQQLQQQESERSLPPVSRKSTFGKDKEHSSHRQALKSVFRRRSISQLREHVKDVAHNLSSHRTTPSEGAAIGTSGTGSPLSSPPSYERSMPPLKKASVISKDDSAAPSLLRTNAGDVAKDSQRHTQSEQDIGVGASAVEREQTQAVPAPASRSQWKLKGMIAVVRHADRTPKQKMKFTFHTKPFVDLLKGHQEEVLLVGEAALKSVLGAIEAAMLEGEEDQQKLTMLRNVLVRKAALPGTKVQIKPMFRKPKDKDKHKDKSKDEKDNKDGKEKKDAGSIQDAMSAIEEANLVAGLDSAAQEKEQVHPQDFPDDDGAAGPAQVRAQTRSDSISEVTMSRTTAKDNHYKLDKLQLVMKWGGEPTHSARYQASDLGENMRNDLLLMNREVLNDVSMFTSSERRVTTSAQIFAAAFLDNPKLPPDFCKVRKDLLDDSNAAKDEMDKVKKRLKGLLRKGYEAPAEFAWPKDGTPEPYVVVRNVVMLMKFHRRVMQDNFSRVPSSGAAGELKKIHNPSQLSLYSDTSAKPKNAAPTQDQYNQATTVQARWCTGEDAELFRERWEKLFNEFTDAEKVDPSKISELYDTMKFDALHNRQFLEWVFTPSKALVKELVEEEGRRLSQAIAAAKGEATHDEDGGRVTRTESVVLREEFEQTHGRGDQPKKEGRADSSVQSAPPLLAPSTPQRARMALRRKSQDVFGPMNEHITHTQSADQLADSPGSSYFNLFRGVNTGAAPGQGENTAKNDIRLEKLNELYTQSKILFDFIGPQEYGITDVEKLEIGLLTSLPLLKEIVKDIEEVQASDDAKAFIYFTKESHIYTLLNCILEGGVHTRIARNAIPELDYLSQICFELYESPNSDCAVEDEDPYNYSIRITISPGCHTFDPLDVQLDSKHCIGCAPRRSLTAHGQWKEVIETLRSRFNTVKLPKSFLAVNLSEKVPQWFANEDGDITMNEAMNGASPVAPAH